MPAFQDVSQGDIYIEYSVVFPTEVSESSRKSMNLLHPRCPTALTCKQSSLISSDRRQDQQGRKTSCRFLTLHIQHDCFLWHLTILMDVFLFLGPKSQRIRSVGPDGNR